MQSSELPDTIDVAIIGGGIAALGIALALKDTSHRVALFDKFLPGAATSANSLRIIHGGFRYLQSLNFSRCLQSARDQHEVLQRYPECVQVLPCVLPLKKGSLRSPVPLLAASSLYSLLCAGISGNLQQKGRIHRQHRGRQFERLIGYAQEGLFCWDDVLLREPDTLIEAIIGELDVRGIVFYSAAELQTARSAENRMSLQFATESGLQDVQARCVVNATGPWVQQVADRLGCANVFPEISWARAVNLVVNKPIEEHYGVAFDGNRGALFFMTPRNNQTAIGTFYRSFAGDAAVLSVSESEIREMVEVVRGALPALDIAPEDVVGYDAGVLPALGQNETGPVLVGSEQVARRGQIIHLLSTKYTTFLSQGRRVARQVQKVLSRGP